MFDLLRDLPASFHSVDLYRRVLARQRSALALLTALLVLVWTTQAVAGFLGVRRALWEPGFVEAFEKVPHLVIEHGELTVDAAQPYVLSSPDGRGALVILDTTGRTTAFGEGSGPGLILLRDRALLRQVDGSERTVPYSPGWRFEAGPVMAREWALWAQRWLPPLLAALLLVGGTLTSLLRRTIEAAVLATLTFPARWLVGSQVGWVDRARLAMVAMTPSIVIDTALVFAARAVETSWGTWISLVLLDLAVLGWALSATRVDPASAALPGEAP
jgi:hypothetical protein